MLHLPQLVAVPSRCLLADQQKPVQQQTGCTKQVKASCFSRSASEDSTSLQPCQLQDHSSLSCSAGSEMSAAWHRRVQQRPESAGSCTWLCCERFAFTARL